MIVIPGKCTVAYIMIDEIDASTIKQVTQFVNNSSFTENIVIMPDTHAGKGAVIGFTMPLNNRLIPNVIGVDKSCGVLSIKFGREALNNLTKDEIDKNVRQSIPMSNKVHKQPIVNARTVFNWAEINKQMNIFTKRFNKRYGTKFVTKNINYDWLTQLCNKVTVAVNYMEQSIGTMGGGNHFIEIGKDEEGYIWVTIHSGSRYLGKQVAEYWQGVAVKRLSDRRKNFHSNMINEIKDKYPSREWNTRIRAIKEDTEINTPRALEYLTDTDMYNYLIDSIFIDFYASLSRTKMSDIVKNVLGEEQVLESIHTVHNYVDYRDFIIRKGAVSAHLGELFVLPFNLEDGILICKGKGNPEWNFSAPHGAGRIYSRTKAKELLHVESVRERLKRKNIYSKVLPKDELPAAYKSAKLIEEAIKPTASIYHRIKPIMSFKAQK